MAARKNVSRIDSPTDDGMIGYRGDPSAVVLRQSGTGVGATVITRDGTEFEIVWAGGEGLTKLEGSSMYGALGVLPLWDEDAEEKLMRHLRAKKARATQLSRRAVEMLFREKLDEAGQPRRREGLIARAAAAC